tara:strand:+ start:191 stop:295 length:105 start_codon:yes stop_codon:yes gene_type:complete
MQALTMSRYLGSKILRGSFEPGKRMVLRGKIGIL